MVRVAVTDIVGVFSGVRVGDANDVEVQIEVDVAAVVVLVIVVNAFVRVVCEMAVAVGLGTIVREANSVVVGSNWVAVGRRGKLSNSPCVEVLVQPATAIQSTMIDPCHWCFMGCLLGLVSRWPAGLHL